MEVGRMMPAGSGRAQRLDPFALPVRFEAADGRSDEHVRQVELHRERVVVRRTLHGMRMALNLPVSAYRGVALRLLPPDNERDAEAAVVLEHEDPSLSLPLFAASDSDEIIAEWQRWGRALNRPLLVNEADGRWREPFPMLGGVRVGEPSLRRRRRSVLRRRRPSIFLRRKPGRKGDMIVHHGEHEIIARN